jgi:hypothetical protein
MEIHLRERFLHALHVDPGALDQRLAMSEISAKRDDRRSGSARSGSLERYQQAQGNSHDGLLVFVASEAMTWPADVRASPARRRGWLCRGSGVLPGTATRVCDHGPVRQWHRCCATHR